MKKFFTLLTILSLSCASCWLTSCDDSDESIVIQDGRLVSDVVIETSMDVFNGMTITVDGLGFQSGDRILLRAQTDIQAQTEVISPEKLSFVLPDEVEDGTVYRFVLVRDDDYQVLGASKINIHLVIHVVIDEIMSASWQSPVVIKGEGFLDTDKLILEQTGTDESPIVEAQSVTDDSSPSSFRQESRKERAGSSSYAAKRRRNSACPNSSSPLR